MIFLLQNFANLKISPGSLDWVSKTLEFWSISWYFWLFKTFFIVSLLAFFSRSFTIACLHIAIPLVNTNLKDTGYLRILDTLFTDLEYLWKIIVLDRVFNKNPLFLSLNYIERSETAISLKNKLNNHPQPYSCWLDDNIYSF